MKPILILRNVKREQPGLIQVVFAERGIPFQVMDLDTGVLPPSQFDGYSALVVMGGPDSANDTTPKMLAEVQLARLAIDQVVPFLGICLGAQVLGKAAGGQVSKSPVREIGWFGPDAQPFQIHVTAAGQRDPLFAGLAKDITVFQLHGEMAAATPEITVLATGDFCPVQVVRVGIVAYGTQCHFELTDELYQCWVNEDPDLQKLDGAALQETWNNMKAAYTTTGKKLLNNWLDILSKSLHQTNIET